MRKLRDRRGITLTEMLCTVLIVLLLTALPVLLLRRRERRNKNES